MIELSNTAYYETFEERESAFNAAVGCMIPAKYKGPQRFWRDFRALTTEAHATPQSLPAYITSNPRDCLAFGSPVQVLAAAHLTGGRHGQYDNHSLEGTAHEFGLAKALYQPIRTLSGGETVRLALAKAWAAADYSDRLTIASPFCWMSKKHVPLIERVMQRYADQGKTTQVLAMTGEDSAAPMSQSRLAEVALPPLTFSLKTRDLRISLGTPINALTAPLVYAGVQDVDQILYSPCLLVGENGQGKSLLAKALCSAVSCRGVIGIKSPSGGDRARLLFQDVVTQTLLRNIEDLAVKVVGCCDPDPADVYREILNDHASTLYRDAMGWEALRRSLDTSLLAVKSMLIAARLSPLPAALVLDEPDWGLSRNTALSFVLAVVRQCHLYKVPVVLISHKPWWQPLAKSVLEITRTPPIRSGDLFGVAIKQKE